MIYQFIKKMDAKKKIGKRIITRIITEEKRLKLRRYLKDEIRKKMIRQVSNAGTSHLEDILQICLQHISPMTMSLSLVSQVSCSGGSLLSCLLDGHSNLHTYPHTFAAENPDKSSWPVIDIKGNPEAWLNIFSRATTFDGVREGFKQDNARFPFIYLPILERQLFIEYLESIQTLTTRHVFDAHMTACLGAWLNYQNHGPVKKFVIASTSGLCMQKQVESNFFETYPDGRLISIIRNPVDWFVAFSRREPQSYGDIESALGLWMKSVRAAMKARERFGDRVCLIQFERLIDQKESVMRHLADFLEIRFDDILLMPTFNKIPIKPNTSFKLERPGIMISALETYKTLSREELNTIEKMTSDVYKQALSMVASNP
jgi:hypothetical protein